MALSQTLQSYNGSVQKYKMICEAFSLSIFFYEPALVVPICFDREESDKCS